LFSSAPTTQTHEPQDQHTEGTVEDGVRRDIQCMQNVAAGDDDPIGGPYDYEGHSRSNHTGSSKATSKGRLSSVSTEGCFRETFNEVTGFKAGRGLARYELYEQRGRTR